MKYFATNSFFFISAYRLWTGFFGGDCAMCIAKCIFKKEYFISTQQLKLVLFFGTFALQFFNIEMFPIFEILNIISILANNCLCGLFFSQFRTTPANKLYSWSRRSMLLTLFFEIFLKDSPIIGICIWRHNFPHLFWENHQTVSIT